MFLKSSFISAGLSLCGIYGAVYVNSDSLSQSHERVTKATLRALVLGVMGSQMASIYMFSNKTMSEKHIEAATILKEALKRNAGVYIKIGQLVASVSSNL